MSAPAGRARRDWPGLGRQGLVLGALGLAVAQLVLQLRGGHYGYDFRGGIWEAGRALLNGRSPFPAPNAHQLLLHPNGFINPPPLAVLGAVFAPLPFGVAMVAFNLLCVAGLIGALRVAGERRVWVTLLCLSSFPFVSSLALGQPDGLLALAAAVAWRRRGTGMGAVAGGALIAAKLLGWPLLIWLLATRRFRAAALTAASAVAFLLLSWATLGFAGLTAYPRLLAADAHAFETRAHSIFTALARAGVPAAPASVLTVALALVLAAAVVWAARGSDLGLFTAALALGILASPIVWQHYLVLLFVPLALCRRPGDPAVWLMVLALWISPSETPATLLQAWAIPLLITGILLRIGTLARASADTAPLVRPAWLHRPERALELSA